jgi:hypothetical protein
VCAGTFGQAVVRLRRMFSTKARLKARPLMCAGLAQAEAASKEEVRSEIRSDMNNQPITVEGYLIKPASGPSNEVRVQMFNSDATYILKLDSTQKDWVKECMREPVKIEAIYKNGGILEPTKLSHWYYDDVAWQMVCECNRYRAAHRLLPLTPLRDLLWTASTHSWNMRYRYGFRHGGTSGWSGENIAAGQPDPVAVTSTWYNSSGHRANMLNPSFRFIGVGYQNGMWTQQFR